MEGQGAQMGLCMLCECVGVGGFKLSERVAWFGVAASLPLVVTLTYFRGRIR